MLHGDQNVERIIEALFSVFMNQTPKRSFHQQKADDLNQPITQDNREVENETKTEKQERQPEQTQEQQAEEKTQQQQVTQASQAGNEKAFFNNLIETVSQNGLMLQCLSEPYKIPDLCLRAVQNNGNALQFVPQKLKTPQICLYAVKQDKQALRFVPEKLKHICETQINLDRVIKNEPLSIFGKSLQGVKRILSSLFSSSGKSPKRKNRLFDFTSSKFKNREQCLVAYLQDNSCYKKIPDQHKNYVTSKAKEFTSAFSKINSPNELSKFVQKYSTIVDSIITPETMVKMLQSFKEPKHKNKNKQKQEVKQKPEIVQNKQIQQNIKKFLGEQNALSPQIHTSKKAL